MRNLIRWLGLCFVIVGLLACAPEAPAPVVTIVQTALPEPTATLARPTTVALQPTTAAATTVPPRTPTVAPTVAPLPSEPPPTATATRVAPLPTATIASTATSGAATPTTLPRGFVFGKFGAGNGDLNEPTGIAVTADAIYVTERGNHRIQRFNLQGGFVWKAGVQGGGDGQLNEPGGIVVLGNNVFVADLNNQRVAVFNATNGAWVRSIGVGGDDVNQLRAPTAVAVDAIGKLFVSDRANKRVQVYERTFEPLRMVGSGGGKPEQFGALGAGGVAVDSRDSIYVSDTSNDRILMFDFRGDFIKAFGGAGNTGGKLLKPQGVALDNLGRVLVADVGNKRIALFNADGSFVENKVIQGLEQPTSVASDSRGAVHVTDTKTHRVIVVR